MYVTKLLRTAAVAACVGFFTFAAHAAPVVFYNGAVDPNRTTWNNQDPPFTAYDQFQLTSTTTISEISWNIFSSNIGGYTSSFLDIRTGLPSSPGTSIFSTTTAATITANGLTTTNTNVLNGYTLDVAGLNITLGPGTYYLGVGTMNLLASIGSGAGSVQTTGPGLDQYFSGNDNIRNGDHMAFTLYGSGANVPAPGAIALLGLGLAGLGAMRRRKVA